MTFSSISDYQALSLNLRVYSKAGSVELTKRSMESLCESLCKSLCINCRGSVTVAELLCVICSK